MEYLAYVVSLELYAKQYVSFKSIESARANGNYDKAILHCVIDFTYKTSPVKRWGVKRPQLIEDMAYMIDFIHTFNAFKLESNAIGYRNKSGELRCIYGVGFHYLYEMNDDLPDFATDIAIGDMSSIVVLDKFVKGGFITEEGDFISQDDHIIDTVINCLNIGYYVKTDEAQPN